jgi:protein TonB
VVIEDNARIQFVRRRQAAVRVLFNPAQRVLMVLVDYPVKPGELPDGRVDAAYNYFDIEGTWPFEERWEEFLRIDEHSTGPDSFPRALGLMTSQGLVQVVPSPGPPELQWSDPSAIAVLWFRGSGGAGGAGLSFDQAEQRLIAQAAERAQTGPGTGISTKITGSTSGGLTGWSASSSGRPPEGGAIRVGGAARAPQKIRDAAPAYPEEARQANVVGIVVLEITVGVDGSVTDAHVLRSIPLLDAAALEAVRHWHYEPTLLNGKPVPVIMTVMVPFAP